MDEPSLLDLLKEKLSIRRLWQRDNKIDEPVTTPLPVETTESEPGWEREPRTSIPWKSLLAFFMAVAGQAALDPQGNNSTLGIFLYLAAGGILLFAIRTGEWQFLSKGVTEPQTYPLSVKRIPFFIFIASLLLAFLTLGGNKFTPLNVFLWLTSIISGVIAFWIPEKKFDLDQFKQKALTFFRDPVSTIRFDPWKLLLVAAFCVAAFFHLHQLNTLPLEMTSDHAEKLLDINRILNGDPMIFFASNGGREPIHFYLAAFLIKVFNTGMNFFTLKLAMALAFLWSLIYVYKLGVEVGTRWTGLFFMLIMGFAAWPNIIAHAGMRLVLTPVFVAPTLFYFLRGLRRSNRNDFILAGLFTGAGLLGYTASRIVPIVLLVGMLIYLIYHKFNKTARSAGWAFLLMALFAFVVFMPLFRYALEFPEFFGQRTLSRITSSEVQLPAHLFMVFLQNLWNALVMPFWKDGTAWVISVPGRPALDIFTAALYFLGLILMVVRWLRTRSWQDLFLLLSIPLLMLPSILALAFPIENPSQSRAGGAMIPVFLITAIALETLLRSLWGKARKVGNQILVVGFAVIILFLSASSNYDIALVKYPEVYRNSTWNSSEMGKVVKDFTGSFGTVDNVWVVAVPYWVDTRLVAMNAGYVDRDFQIWPENLEVTQTNTGSKLFIVKGDDVDGMAKLRALYPTGFSTYHSNPVPGHDFIAYFVPSDVPLQ